VGQFLHTSGHEIRRGIVEIEVQTKAVVGVSGDRAQFDTGYFLCRMRFRYRLQVDDARIFGGMHFRQSGKEGNCLGRKATEYVINTRFSR
jgi:hypothetical protein